MQATILITGFGPFPGAPFNPTGPLVMRLARLRRPAWARVKIVTHIFPTSYAAIDRDLPTLIARHRPAALLMFGLAAKARTLRIETRARNARKLLPDAAGHKPRNLTLTAGGPAAIAMPAPARLLFAALQACRLPVVLSNDAGGYLCNYLCWRAAEAAGRKHSALKLAAFVHVPLVPRGAGKRGAFSLPDLTRAGAAALTATAAACHV